MDGLGAGTVSPHLLSPVVFRQLSEVTNFIYICTMFPAPPAAPQTQPVMFPIPREQFTISWDEPPLNVNETIDAYFVNISGPEDLCGNNNMVQRVTERNYTCTIQPTPREGDRYTFTVAAANCGGILSGPASSPIHLQGINIEQLILDM